MNAKQLFQAGKLKEAITLLGGELRDNPTDTQRRTFLFELLCFAGEFDRAEKHLNLLADQGQSAQMGVVLYLAVLHAEKLRRDMFKKSDFPSGRTPAAPESLHGTLDGKPFESFEDSDPRIGTRLEVFAAGAYLWIPFEHIVSIETQAPKRLRDLLWVPALVRTGPAFKGTELGEVMIPAISPLSYEDGDDNVKLGRSTEWRGEGAGSVPVGQKTFLVDGDDIPILEFRKIEFRASAAEASSAGNSGGE